MLLFMQNHLNTCHCVSFWHHIVYQWSS